MAKLRPGLSLYRTPIALTPYDWRARRMDVTASAGEQGLELNDPAIQQMRRADGALLAEQLLALLGLTAQEFTSNSGARWG
jgi:hypothetical protein